MLDIIDICIIKCSPKIKEKWYTSFAGYLTTSSFLLKLDINMYLSMLFINVDIDQNQFIYYIVIAPD